MNRNNTGVLLLDRKGRPFFNFYQAKQKEEVPISDIPKVVQQAVVAAEDKDFYHHQGFSLKAIAGAVLADIRNQDLSYGGSTITQQLVKNSLLKPEKTFLRKYQEIVLAQEIEKRYPKDEILEMYLNSVYWGGGKFGVKNAVDGYFGKDIKDIDLAEASFLAGILPSPSSLSQPQNIKEAKKKQTHVLDQMIEMKLITAEQKDEAVKAELKFSQNEEDMNNVAPHFALMVRDVLIDKFGEEQISRSGFRVKTSLDLGMQEFAQEAVKTGVDRLTRNRVSNGGAVAIDPKSGEILALVGSKDWNDEKYGKFNVATALRQPGSSFKPIIYEAAMEKGLITPATPLKDQPTTFSGNYKPKNYDGKFRGVVLARRALANSLNVPSVQVMQMLGVENGVAQAKKLGLSNFDDPSNFGLSMVLGAGETKLTEMTNVYATLANRGEKNDLTSILEITDKINQTIYTYTPKPQKVLNPQHVYLVSSILSDNNARAEVFGPVLNISRPAAVKTGTSENYKDSLTFGYTPSLAVGVWVGNNDGTPMDNIAGSLGAAPIWKSLMEKYLANTPVENFEKPEDVVRLKICSFNGLLTDEATSSAITEVFVKGSEPTKRCVIPKPAPATPSAKPEENKEAAKDDQNFSDSTRPNEEKKNNKDKRD